MTISVSQIANTQTFASWLTRTNQIANLISTNVVTADASSNGSITSGNVFVNGFLTIITGYLGNYVSGGTVASPNTLNVSSNLSVNNVVGFSINTTASYATILANNVSFVNTALISGQPTFINPIRANAEVTFNGTTGFLVGNSTVNVFANSTTLLLGNVSLTTSTNALSITATAINFSNISITNNVIMVGNSTVNNLINATSYTGTANNSLYLGGIIAASYWTNNESGSLTGNINFTANLTTSGANTNINSTGLNVSALTLFTGNVSVGNLTTTGLATIGNANVTGNLTVSGTNTNINSNTYITGSNLVVSSANLNVSSNVTLAGATLTVDSNAVFVANLTVTGNNTVLGGSNVYVTANTSLGSLSVAGNTILAGTSTSISSNVSLTGNTFAVTGTTTLANATLSGTSSVISSNLSVTGATVSIGANTSLTANLTVTGYNTNLGGSNVNITANVSAQGNLTVAGITTLNGNSVIGGANAYVTANLTAADNLSVLGNTTLAGTNTIISSNLTVSGSTLTIGNIVSNTTAISLGNSTVNVIVNSTAVSVGNVIATGSLFIGNTTVNDSITSTGHNISSASGNVNLTSTLVQVISGTSYAQTTAGAVLLASVASNLVANSSSLTIGNSTVNASINSTFWNAGANNALYLGGNPAANFVQNTDSRTLSGNLVFSANVNFTGANTVLATTNVNITANLTVTGSASLSGALNTFGGTNNFFSSNTILGGTNTSITSNLNVTGTTILSGALTTLGGTNSYFTSNATHAANVTFAGTLTTLGGTNTYVTSNLTVTGITSITSNTTVTGANISFNGNVTITGTNTNIISNVNISGTTLAIGSLAVINSSGSIMLGTGISNTVITSTNYTAGNSTVYTTGNGVNDIWVGVGVNTSINASSLLIGSNVVVNASNISVSNVTAANGTTGIVNNNIAVISQNNIIVSYYSGNSTSNSISNTTITANTLTIGNSTVYSTLNAIAVNTNFGYFGGNVIVLGSLTVTGNVISSGNTTASGSYNPSVDATYVLGNTTNRWSNIYSVNVYSNVLFSNTIIVGNSSVNLSINSTAFSGTANSATYFGGQTASYYANATIYGGAFNGTTVTGTVGTFNANVSANGLIVYLPSDGNQVKLVKSNYGVIFRNDDTSFYILSTASGNSTGTFNSLRPLYFNLATGAVNIDGTGVGTTFGGSVTACTHIAGVFGSGTSGFVANSSFLGIGNNSANTSILNGQEIDTFSLALGNATPSLDSPLSQLVTFTNAYSWSPNPATFYIANATITGQLSHIMRNYITYFDSLSSNSTGGLFPGNLTDLHSNLAFGSNGGLFSSNQAVSFDAQIYNYGTNTANVNSSTINNAIGFQSMIRTAANGIINTAYGVKLQVSFLNSNVSGNIGTAYGVFSNIGFASANANIGTAYHLYGVFPGAANVGIRYGVYISGEGNNYFSNNLTVGGNVSIGNTTIAGTLTTLGGTNTYITSNATFVANLNAANIVATNVVAVNVNANVFYGNSLIALVNVATGISVMNTTAIAVGANVVFNSANIVVSNSLTNTVIYPDHIYVGNSTASITVNSSFFTGTSNNTTYLNGQLSSYYANVIAPVFSTTMAVGANVIVNTTAIFIGNSTVNTVVNSTVFTGTANNANYLGGTAAASFQLNSTLAANVVTLTSNNATYFNGQAATFYVSNSTSGTYGGTSNNSTYLGGIVAASYQLNSTLAANVATLTSNNASYLGGVGSASYQLNSTLAANVAAMAANNTTYFNNQLASFYVSNSSIGNYAGTANNALYLGGTTAASYQLNSTLAANVATMSSNNANYLGTIAAASYQLNSTLSTNVATLTSNNSLYLGGIIAANYVQNTDSRTLSGNLSFTGANHSISGTNAYITSNLTVTGITNLSNTFAATPSNGDNSTRVPTTAWISVPGNHPQLVGDTGSGGTAGIVPAPPANSAQYSEVLGANGSWIGQMYSGRNLLINGNFSAYQRQNGSNVFGPNTGGTTVVGGNTVYTYTLDRWFAYASNTVAANATISQGQILTTAYPFELGLQIGYTSGISNVTVGQRIMANNCCWVANTTCVLSVSIFSGGFSNVVWSVSYATGGLDSWGTLASPTKTQIANGMWNPVPGGTRTTFSTPPLSIPRTATGGLEILFSVPTTNSSATNGILFYEAQFEQNLLPTPFERKSLSQVLNDCYFYSYGMTANNTIGYGNSTNNMNYATGHADSATQGRFVLTPPTPMRVPPTVTTSNGNTFAIISGSGTTATSGSFTVNTISPYNVRMLITSSGLTTGSGAILADGGSGNSFIFLSSEI